MHMKSELSSSESVTSRAPPKLLGPAVSTLIWFRPALLRAAILLCCWGGQGGKASTASAEGGLARWELRGGVLSYITRWPNPWQNKVGSMSLFIGSTILFIGNTILFIGSTILFIGSLFLFIGSFFC